MPLIVFTDDDFHGLDHQQDNPMVITVEIKNYAVKKVQWIRAALLISSTRPPTKNFNFLTLSWSHMTSQYMAFPVNRYPPEATLTSTPSFGRGPKLKPSQSASSSSTRQHPITSSWAVLPSISLAPSFPPLT